MATQKPIYPITEKEELSLIEHEECHAIQFESLAEYCNEVAQFGDASFQRPEIKPLVYIGELKVLKDKVDKWAKDLKDWGNAQFATEDVSDELIPF